VFDEALSQALLGRGGIHAVRPEKISIAREGTTLTTDRTALGTLTEIIYVGSSTRLIVDLDAGTRLAVLEQNDAQRVRLDDRGSRVTVGWHERDTVALETTPSTL
jgi:putative spermidine/putrescine transport system ATP-binding protein